MGIEGDQVVDTAKHTVVAVEEEEIDAGLLSQGTPEVTRFHLLEGHDVPKPGSVDSLRGRTREDRR